MVKKRGKVSHFDHYRHSVVFTKSFFMTVIYDFAYCITIFSLFMFLLWLFATMLEPAALALQHIGGIFSLLVTPDHVTPGIEATLDTQFATLQSFYIQAGLWFFGSMFILFAVTSAYKSLIWSHLTKQKFTKKYFLQFFKVNVLWQFIWLFLACIGFFLFEVNFATNFLLVELFLYMYFTPFLRSQLTAKHTIKRIYHETFIHGVKNIPHFFIAIMFMIITVTLTLWLASVLFSFVYSLSVVLFTGTFIFVTISWVRFYFSIVARHVMKK
jgi:hypothetical protein